MADLLSQNIGTNYKSILNLDATTINTPLDATLRAVTDGMGTSSPLQLSSTKVAIGTNLYFNGITNLFPMIKRNGTAIDFRLADDSAFCDVTGKTIYAGDVNNYIKNTGEWLCNVNFVSQSNVQFNGIPTGRSSAAGRLYKDTAANILANGDLVVGIRI